MAERLKAHDWKSCGCKPAWVRIPLRPLFGRYGAWLSLVERCVRDAEVPGSNPGSPTTTLLRSHARSAASYAGRGPRGAAPPGGSAASGTHARSAASYAGRGPRGAAPPGG